LEDDKGNSPNHPDDYLLEVLSENVQTLPANLNVPRGDAEANALAAERPQRSPIAFAKVSYLAILACLFIVFVPSEQDEFY